MLRVDGIIESEILHLRSPLHFMASADRCRLDHGEELVWTMKQNYDAEETEYANITTACLEIERSIGTFINDDSLATLKNTSSRHRADLVEKLINSFIGVLEIRDLRMDVARAREARQKEGRGVRAVKK